MYFQKLKLYYENNDAEQPVGAEKLADVAELADAHGSGPCAARLVGSTPTVGTKKCGYGISAVHQPSKLVRGVRPPLPAPLVGFPSG